MPEWDFHLRKTTGYGGVHGGNNLVKMLSHKPPRGVSKNYDSDLPVVKILLIAHVFVGRNKNIEARAFGQPKQLPV